MSTITVTAMETDYTVRDKDCLGRECLRLAYVPAVKRDGTGAHQCKRLGDCPTPLPAPSTALRRSRQGKGMVVS